MSTPNSTSRRGTGGGGAGQAGNLEDFSGQTGTAFTLSSPPTSGLVLMTVNGLSLRKVGASPGMDQFSQTGTAVTTGFAIGASDEVFVFYLTSSGTGQTGHLEDLSGQSGTVFLLSQAPVNGLALVVVNGLTMRKVNASPGVNQYTLSGNTLTMGFNITAVDDFSAFYLT